MIICGIEEAGRGPVIGPMVIAGVTFKEEDEDTLREMGVKDSKLLLPSRREALYERIIKKALEYRIIILSPKEVDDSLEDPGMNLNWLEAVTSAKIINSLKCDRAILDCPSNNISAYRSYVKERVKGDVEIIAEHKADLKYAIVGAGSILAKVTRDREIEKIKKRFNVDFGSGYPSDPKTKMFLEKNYDKYDFFRKSWDTYRRVVSAKSQKSLSNF